jgi:hypothetical protein
MSQGELLALYLSVRLMRQFRGTQFEPDLRQAIAKLGEMLPACAAQTLGPEPSYPALGPRGNYVANALLCLRMRKKHRANTLNQHWGHMGNIFPYFSPVPIGFIRRRDRFSSMARFKPAIVTLSPQTVGRPSFRLAHIRTRIVRLFAFGRTARGRFGVVPMALTRGKVRRWSEWFRAIEGGCHRPPIGGGRVGLDALQST